MSVSLRHLDVLHLADSAGGDPWLLNKTVQSGSPGEISEFGGRTLGTIGAGWAAGAAWGTFVGPQGTLIVGFLGAIGGGIGGEKAVNWMMGK